MERTYREEAATPYRRLVKSSRWIIFLLLLLLCLTLGSCRGGASDEPGTRTLSSTDFRIIPPGQVMAARSRYLYATPWFYLFFLVGPVGLLVVILAKKHKRGKFLAGMLLLLGISTGLGGQADPALLLRQGVDRFLIGDTTGALDAFLLATDQLPSNALLHYNLALCYYRLDKAGHAVYHLKVALSLENRDSRISGLLKYLETTYKLGFQIDSNPHFHPDIPLIITLVFFTLICALLAVMQYIKKGQLMIALLLCGFFTLLSLGVFIYEQIHTHQEIGIITGGLAPIKQIPDDMGIEKIKLKEGTIVKVLWQFEDTYFIRTGRGLKGWVKKENLLR